MNTHPIDRLAKVLCWSWRGPVSASPLSLLKLSWWDRKEKGQMDRTFNQFGDVKYLLCYFFMREAAQSVKMLEICVFIQFVSSSNPDVLRMSYISRWTHNSPHSVCIPSIIETNCISHYRDISQSSLLNMFQLLLHDDSVMKSHQVSKEQVWFQQNYIHFRGASNYNLSRKRYQPEKIW